MWLDQPVVRMDTDHQPRPADLPFIRGMIDHFAGRTALAE
jgi:hypothetical protein